MRPTVIKSKDNSLLRRARAVRDGKIDDLIFVEGLRLCEEALSAGLKIEAVIYSEEIAVKERPAQFLKQVSAVTERQASINERLLATISYTKTPQGIVVLARRPDSSSKQLIVEESKDALIIVMHGVSNPLNVGAIMRSAEAAGATAAIATKSTTDPFSAKSLRGAMGSAFRVPTWVGPDYLEMLSWCRARNIRTVCADVATGMPYTDIDWKRSTALIIGPEATGLSPEELAAAGTAIRIPMHGKVESLNAGVAAGIMLYEAARQRQGLTQDV